MKPTKKKNIIYGFHAVESVVLNDSKNINFVWIDKKRKDKRVKKITEILQKKKIRTKFFLRNILDKEAKHKKHQGIIAEYEAEQPLTQESLDEILKKEDIFLLILDEIKDPHNLGAILRTANSVKVDAVITTKNQAVGLTPTVRKIASGGAEKTPLIQVTNLSQTLKKLKENEVWCIGLAGESKKTIYEEKFTEKLAIVMGSENKGLRRLTRENCDTLIKIPMQGEVESLNVSVATGVVLFEALRQRKTNLLK